MKPFNKTQSTSVIVLSSVTSSDLPLLKKQNTHLQILFNAKICFCPSVSITYRRSVTLVVFGFYECHN